MNLALWIVANILAVAFAGSGLMKQFVPKDELDTSGQGWAQDHSPTNIRLIGLAGREPGAVPRRYWYRGCSRAAGRPARAPLVAVNVVLIALAVFVAWGRFGPYSFTP